METAYKKISKITTLPPVETTVYNLSVDEVEEFFANSILVHNCPDCPNYVTNGGVPANQIVPVGEACRCHGNCRCTVEYRFNPARGIVNLSDRLI